ncbi:hypothetical protein LCGC14_2755300, partial [marine sediment metagenome]
MNAPAKYFQPEVLSRISRLELRARHVVEGFVSGMHKSPYKGFSVEFASHRSYVPGDDIRHIDWRVYGKADRFFIKEYEEGTAAIAWYKSALPQDPAPLFEVLRPNVGRSFDKRLIGPNHPAYDGIMAALNAFLACKERRLETMRCEILGIDPPVIEEGMREDVEDAPESAATSNETTYDYTDADGNVVYQVVRKEPKAFRQQRPHPNHPGEWIAGRRGGGRVLYNLPAVLEKKKVGGYVIFVEGEKDCETLRINDVTATSIRGGSSGKWHEDFTKTLEGAKVAIIPDNDEPGKKHA